MRQILPRPASTSCADGGHPQAGRSGRSSRCSKQDSHWPVRTSHHREGQVCRWTSKVTLPRPSPGGGGDQRGRPPPRSSSTSADTCFAKQQGRDPRRHRSRHRERAHRSTEELRKGSSGHRTHAKIGSHAQQSGVLTRTERIVANLGELSASTAVERGDGHSHEAPDRARPQTAILTNSARYRVVAGRLRAGRDSNPRPPDP